jgi:hypothetical protein
MANEPNPAIELLISQISELERKANAYRASVNVLLERDGLPPKYPNGGGDGPSLREAGSSGSSTPTQVKPDAFYGKPQQTAVRELLAIRKASGTGPAKPNEILDGLRSGGYQVEAKSDEIALVGLRAMLRKRTTVFHKLPNGTWGLREWYPNAKPHAGSADKAAATNKSADIVEDDDAADESEDDTATTAQGAAAA